MSELNQSSVNLLERAIDDKIRKAVRGGQSTHLATVTRVSTDGTTWVHVFGGSDETPVRRMTTAAQVGDVINVIFSGLSCMGVGNVSSPSATTGLVTKVASESAKAIAGVMSGLLQVRTLVADKVSTKELDAEMATILTAAIENATIRVLNANYAKVNAANIDTAAIQDAWVDKLLVETNLLANDGTVFTLDAVQVNAASITTGTLDVRRLIITREETDPETGELVEQKYLVNIDPETSQPTYEKLDGNIVAPRSIGADKIEAHSITANELTIQNIVGTGGWINLANGTFSYGNQATGEGISWDGSQLNITGAVHIGSSRKQLSDMLTAEDVTVTQNPTQTGYDVDIAGNTFSLVNGSQGPAGTSVTVSKVEYATSTSESQPSSGWSTTAPSTVAEGSWLWVKTTYSDGTDSVIRAKQGKSGTNGTSYYTHVRYSESADGTGHVATPTSATKYIGVYTGTSSSAPSSKTSYKWSKYVGEDGAAGHSPAITTSHSGTTTTIYADGTAIGTVEDGDDGTTPTITASKSGGTTTVKVDGTTIATINDGTSVTVSKIEYGTSSSASTSPSSWSTTVPTSITKGKWLWVKTTYSDNSTATTKSYVGTDGEDGKSVAIRSATKADGVTTVVLEETDGTTTTTKTLTIADGQDGGSGQPGANGYVHTAWANSADGATDFSTTVSTGKKYLGVYTDNTEADSTSPGAYSWSLIKGETGETAQWYYGTALTHTSGTATLATSSTDGVVVGAMYLNNSTSLCYKCTAISGTTATWTYAGNLTDGVIDNINVGGRNLLRKTGSLVTSDLVLTRSTVADGVINVTPTTSSSYAKFIVDYLDFDDYGDGVYTVSFDARAIPDTTYTKLKGPMVYPGINIPSRLNYTLSTSYDRYRSYTLDTLTYEWVRYSQTFSIPGDLNSGQESALASGSFLTVQFAMTGSYAPMQVRNVKLERGNVATDWTPAPEDQTTYVDNSVYQSSQPNLSPFFSYQPPTDTSYWVLATNQTTNVYDGWMTFDMSAASQSARVIHIRPKRQEWVKPGGRYTLLVELADIVASGTVQWMPRANNDIDQIAFDGSTDTLPSKSFYVSGTALSNAISDSTRTSLVTVVILVKANATFSGKVRVSLYEGDYSGPYKPYVGSLLYGSAADSVEYIVGTQTAGTNVWTGVTKDAAIYTGKKIAYYLPYAGNSSAATLNLTLATGSTTGAKNVRINNSNVTTHFPANSVINLTYDGTYWKTSNYNDSTGINNARYRTQWANAIKAVTAITADRIICGTASGYKNIGASVSFDLSYPLLYATAAIEAAATGTGNYLTYNGVNASSNGTITSGVANKTLYLKGTVSGNTFTIASSGFLTTKVPTTDDGFVYIPLGVMYSATNIYFSSSKELYAYKDGAFGPISIREASAIRSGANSRAQRIYYRTASESTAPASGPTTWVTTATDVYDAWTTKVPPLAVSNAEGVTKYPHLYTCVQYQSVAQNAAGTTCTCSAVLKDDSITKIDGDVLIDGTVMTDALAAGSVTAAKIDATELAVKGELILGDVRATQVADGVVTFTTLKSDLRNSLNDLNDTVGNLSSAIQVDLDSDNPSITLIPSSSGSGVIAELSNNALSFKQNGNVVAQISNDQLLIENAQVRGNLFFGGYAFIPRSNGNLSLKWIGTGGN